MNRKRTLIHNVYVVNEGRSFHGYVEVEGEFIKSVGEGDPEDSLKDSADIIDGRGRLLLPGVIDTHVHFRDPGFPLKEDISTGAAAAARG
ncbi:MAG: dihydroorotase, partial [Paramuribaculum sp.]|nr:dihydroorotase [Paramuribaculum sp.]